MADRSQASPPDRRTVERRLPRYSELKPLLKPRPFVLDGVERRLRSAESVSALRDVARHRVPRGVFDYTDGAAGDEQAMNRSRAVLDGVQFSTRVLRNVAKVDLSSSVLGAASALPVGLSPTGFTRMMNHEGEIGVARAAARAGVPYALSTMGTTSIEDLARAVPEGRHWFQLYLWRNRESSIDLVRRAGAAGFEALVLTVDTPVAGNRLRDVRNGLTIPPSLTMRTVLDAARKPRWWIDLFTTEPLRFASLSSFNGTVAELANSMFDPSASMADVEWLRTQWDGKLVVKGILRAEDALAAVSAGADAIVVSNHGGRQLDRAVAPLDVLPEIVAAVGDHAEVIVDGGVRSGGDVAAALCLGADFVMMGRAYLYGLMAGGERGVDRVLELITAELTLTMQLLGATSVDQLTPESLRR